jgi:hypothetical protein
MAISSPASGLIHFYDFDTARSGEAASNVCGGAARASFYDSLYLMAAMPRTEGKKVL